MQNLTTIVTCTTPPLQLSSSAKLTPGIYATIHYVLTTPQGSPERNSRGTQPPKPFALVVPPCVLVFVFVGAGAWGGFFFAWEASRSVQSVPLSDNGFRGINRSGALRACRYLFHDPYVLWRVGLFASW